MPNKCNSTDDNTEFVSIPLNCPPVNIRAKLTVHHELLQPDEVTKLMAIEPTKSHRKGDLVNPSSVPKTSGFWMLNTSELASEADVNVHLSWLLEKVIGKEHILKELQSKGNDVTIGCRLGIAHWNSLFGLNTEILQRLASLNMPIYFDIYDEQYDDDVAD